MTKSIKLFPIFISIFLLVLALLYLYFNKDNFKSIERVQAATITAASCSNADVQAAINQASDGDTVRIPAGNCTWSTGYNSSGNAAGVCTDWFSAGVWIPNTKGIKLEGAGVGSTILTANCGVMIWADTAIGRSQFSLAGIEFRPGTGGTEMGTVVVKGQAKDWRVHHNQFGTAASPFSYRQFYIGHDYGDCTYGLWDHNTHYGSGGTGFVKFGGCNGGGNFGDNVWRTPLNWGGSDWMFFEDNNFYCTASSYGTGCGAPDNLDGARIVYRYNYTGGMLAITHGAESGGRPRGVRALDVYNNTVVNQVSWHDGLVSIRSGTARIHDNTISGVFYQRLGKVWIANWGNDRGLPYGNCSDPPAEGLCSGNYETACTVDSNCSVVGGTCQWVHDPSGDGNGDPCRDQPGRGLDTGVTTPQALEPIFSWGNSGPNTTLAATTGGVIENRDFYNCSSYNDCISKGMPAYTAYVYPHPLQSGGAPSDTTPPSVPSSLSGTAISSSQINLSWSVSTDTGGSGLAGYRIYRCQGAGCTPTTQINTSALNSYSDTGLSANTTYVYRVAAYDAAGNVSGQSSSASATTQSTSDTTPPTISNGSPSGTLPAGTTQTNISVATNENAICRYSSTINTSYSSMTNTFSTTGATSHSVTLTGLTNGQTYNRYVRCQDAAGNANTSDYTITFSVASVGATAYYVRTTSCSDVNPGTQSQPWCRAPGMAGWTGTATLRAGDTVYFDRSGTWTASSGSYLLSIMGGVSYIGDTWGTGTRAKFQATGNIESVVRWYDDDSTYETVLKGFELDANHYVANGIGMNYPSWSYDNSPLTGAIKRIQNNVVHDTYSETARGEYRYGIIVSSWGAYGTYEDATVENVEILDNVVYNQSRTGIGIYPGNSSNSYRVGKILIRGNEVYDTAQDPGYDAGLGIFTKNYVYDAVIEYNYVHGYHGSTGAAILLNSDIANCSGPTNINIRYNILTTISPSCLHIRTYGHKDADIYGNILYNCSQGVYIDGGTTDSLDLVVHNNTLYNTNIWIPNFPATVSRIEVKNNVVYAPSGYAPLTDSANKITSHSNNLFYRSGGGTLVSSGGTSYTSSNLSSYESTALSSNPLFTNLSNLPTGFTGTFGVDKQPNNNGLSSQSGSPAIDSGANLGSPYNSSINSKMRPQGSGWDRGAYEISGGAPDTSPPAAPTGVVVS